MNFFFSKISQNSGSLRYLKNTGWLLGEKVLRLTFGLFVSVWVARYLQPAQFGVFSYIQSFVSLFVYFASLGLDGIVVREIIKQPEKTNEILGTSFVLRLIGFCALLLVLALATSLAKNTRTENFFIFLFSTSALFQSFNVIDFYFQSKVLGRSIVIANVIAVVISSLFKIVFIILKFPLTAFIIALLIENILLAILLVYQYQRNGNSILKWTVNKQLALELISYSWPLILSGIVVAIYMKTDQIMLKFLMGEQAVGQYSAALKLSEAWYFIPMVVCNSLFPAILNAKQSSTELYQLRIQRLYTILIWGGVAIALATTLFGSLIIQILYGYNYDLSASVLKIHIWTGIFVGLGVASSKWFMAENLQRFSFFRSLWGAIINVILNWILIPKFGIIGSAYATLAAQIVASYLANCITKETRVNFKMQTNAFIKPIAILKS